MNRNYWPIVWIIIIAVVVIFAAKFYFGKQQPTEQGQQQGVRTTMQITSPAFAANQPIPMKYSCEGQSINPQLNISGVASGAKSLALILHDPDAPLAGGFTHWVLFNIDPKTSVIAENSVPQGAVVGANGAGQSMYVGPCPPSGVHHYHFMLYALDQTLGLDQKATQADLEKAMAGHILDQTELIGTYQKSGK